MSDKVHRKVGEAEGGDVCACGWWGPSQGEHEEVLAEEHQTRAGVPSDEQVDRLSAAVDRAFAERDRLWAHARATGRDEDDQAMLRQDERADALLDQYTVAVREQMAEVEQRRAENIARYGTERDEQWMNVGDAARSPLPPPPAAEPYVPPTARWTPAPLTMSDAELNAAARDWVTDCTWREDPEDLDDLTDEEVRRGVNRHYEGGWQQFVQDTHGYDPPKKNEPPPTTRTTGSTGGTTMTSIEGARGTIMRAHQDAQTANAQLAAARDSLEDAQNGLRHGTEGSNQSEADQAHAQLAEAMNKIDEARSQVESALQEFEGVAQRL